MTATPNTAALITLLERVEAGDEDFITCDSWIEAWDVVAPQMQTYRHKSDGACASIIAGKAYRGSLDAAKALFDAVLPGWMWGRQWSCHMWVEPSGMPGRSERYYSDNADPARAWLIAILRALIATNTY